MSTVQLQSFVMPIGQTGNNSVEILAKDFIGQLAELNTKPEFDYYTREDRGHFRFYPEAGGKIPVSISKTALPLVQGKNVNEKLMWCLKNLVLRSGVSSPEFGANKFLGFGVRGDGGNLETGTINLKQFVEAIAG